MRPGYQPRSYSTQRKSFLARELRSRPWLVGLVAAVLAAGGLAYWNWIVAVADVNLRVELPPDLAVAPPGADVAPGIAAFAGYWGGDRWDGGPSPHSLVVESVRADGTATVVYAWGANQEEHSAHGWWRLHGRIADGHLALRLPTGNSADYSIGADGRLLGRDTNDAGWRSYALLDRIDGSDRATAIAEARKRSGRLWREIDIPEHARTGTDRNTDLTLRATLYRLRSPGRQPLVILNHGSLNVASEGGADRFEAQARLFLSLGHSVIIPLRRGRGGSGGTLEEASPGVTPRTVIDAGLEDIDAVVEAMKAEPFVDPSRIVLVGYERGGLLGIEYAARFPGKVAAALNFSGYWSPAALPEGAINAQEFATAGGAKPPSLWIYAENDAFYPFEQARHNFEAFAAAGGNGRFVAIPDARGIATYGSRLFFWSAKWEATVTAFLQGKAEPAGAGMALVDVADPLGGDPMLAAIYYPAVEAHDSSELGVWTVDALRDAPPREGRFPTVVLSPGYGGGRAAMHDIATGLARNGFIVVTVSHPGDDWEDRDAWRTDRVLVGREYDLRSALDAALADPVFGDHIDPDRIGVAGFSLGGYTALLLLGARPDFTRFTDYCRDPGMDGSCATASGPPSIRPGLTFFRDPRIKAGFLMAPGPGFFFTREGLADVTVPIHIDDPALDEVVKRPFGAERIRDLLPTPPEYSRVPGVGHYIYSAPCWPALRAMFPEICTDPAGADRVAFHARLVLEMAEFFERALGTPALQHPALQR